MSSSSKVLPLVVGFIKGGNKQPASKPGFGHALKLSYNLIAKEKLSWKEKILTYQYKFTEDVDKATPGLLMAIMDELTTNACFGVGQPSAPGVSLQMQVELAADVQALQSDEMDVVSTVVKLGRTISFTRCEFFQNKKLIAFGSHVKYMKTGSYVMDIVFNNAWAWNLYEFFAGDSVPDQYEEKHLWKGVIGPCLEYQNIGDATFSINSEHVNPMGGLHGGCHALLLEMVGETLAKDMLKPEGLDMLVLESLQIDYHSIAKGKVKVVAEALVVGVKTLQMRVGIYRSNGRMASEGKLRWTVKQQQSRL
eukprot:CAMPEP_0119030078 /NCGR_PEP_ID=MMETSP1176-20130426/40850_1 /TAXON_ID=265551 /ORGANISM="Synedropsis recta cf, Strain CCMP1620" /LENGTH=307 /DNA_ID=CAMNT_0006986443 /DNA_START=53 /DNA_END=976 /DNA_ORIENTATION=-